MMALLIGAVIGFAICVAVVLAAFAFSIWISDEFGVNEYVVYYGILLLFILAGVLYIVGYI
jgi:UPF0716 family protein affecting phage T7 exclusion